MKNFVFVSVFILAASSAQVRAQEVYLIRNAASDRSSVEVVRQGERISLRKDESAELHVDNDIIHLPEGFSGTLEDAKKQQRQNNGLIRKVANLFVEAADKTTNAASRTSKKTEEIVIPQGVDVTDIGLDIGGTQCYFDIPLRLWRSQVTVQQSYVLAGASSSARLFFAEGDVTTKWPENVLLSDGSGYVTIKEGDNGGYKSFNIKQIDIESDENVSVSLLVKNECEFQARILAFKIASKQKIEQ